MDQIISKIKQIFPLLSNDSKFKISSPPDTNYNCIAWAFQLYKDRWMQPPKGIRVSLDAVTWWPDGVTEGMHIDCLIQAFEAIGFIQCESAQHEKGFIKVALYYNPQNKNWTHAARESRNGDYWMSKLGTSHDIHHGTPFTLEGDNYGKVYCIMKKEDR